MAAKRGLSAGLLVGLLGLATPIAAQQAPAAPADSHAEEAAGERRNELALVLAGTRERPEGETSFTVGPEYARRVSSRFALVGELEVLDRSGHLGIRRSPGL
jgi:hypothetical protein